MHEALGSRCSLGPFLIAHQHANGLIREYFPKGTDFSAVTGGEVEEVYDALNRRPRKRLGWRTPWEVFHGEALHLL